MDISIPELYSRLGISAQELQSFCEQFPIVELAFFGSVLRNDFQPSSDIDILIRIVPEAHFSLMDLVGLSYKFEEMLDRKVDLIEKDSVEKSPNWLRRQEILNNYYVIYESGRLVSA